MIGFDIKLSNELVRSISCSKEKRSGIIFGVRSKPAEVKVIGFLLVEDDSAELDDLRESLIIPGNPKS